MNGKEDITSCLTDLEIASSVDASPPEGLRARVEGHLSRCEKCRGRVKSWEDLGRIARRTSPLWPGESCPQPEEWAEFLEGKTSWGVRRRLDLHLVECDYCRTEYARFRSMRFEASGEKPSAEISELVRGLVPRPEKTHVAGVRRPAQARFNYWPAIAAAGAAAAILAALLVVFGLGSDQGDPVRKKAGAPAGASVDSAQPAKGAATPAADPAGAAGRESTAVAAEPGQEPGEIPGEETPPEIIEGPKLPPDEAAPNTPSDEPVNPPQSPEGPGVEVPQEPGETPKEPGDQTRAEESWVSAEFQPRLLKGDAFGDLGAGAVDVLGAYLPIVRAGTLGVPVKAGKEALLVDSDGDGRYDATVPATRKGGVVAIKTTYDGGLQGLYYAWFTCKNGLWSYRSYNCMAGRIGGATVFLFDENGNARFNDAGIDRIAFGTADTYSYLSSVALVGENLFNMRVSASGNRVEVQRYTGETGTLDIHSGFHGCGWPETVVFSNGEIWLNVAAAGKPVRVPPGSYHMIEGTIEGPKAEISFGGSAETAVQVDAGGAACVEWGGPLTIEFLYENGGNRIAFRTDQVQFVGLFGERYFRGAGQAALARTRVVVRDAANLRILKEIVASAPMSGSWVRPPTGGFPSGAG